MAWVIVLSLAAGVVAALVWVVRRWVAPAASNLCARWHWRWWRRQQAAHEVTRRSVTPEVEERWIDHLVESFQRDVFCSCLGPGFASPNGKELPSVVAEVRSSGQSGARMSFACGRARSRLENRLRDLEQSWEFSPEALDRLEREVQASYQILMTCHTPIQNWQ